MEYKIGQIFEVDGEWYQCVEETSCGGCAFDTINCAEVDDIVGNCLGVLRRDGKSVVFRKVEKVGEPFERNGYMYQEYKTHIYPLLMSGGAKIPTDNGFAVIIKKRDIEENNNAKLSNSENIGKKLKAFDLQAAKSGKPVCTRDGRKARIICFDSKNDSRRPIVALVEHNDNELLYEYTIEGKERFSHISTTGTSDLMMLPEKKEGWAVIRRSDIYENEEQAKEALLESYEPMMIRQITWEE